MYYEYKICGYEYEIDGKPDIQDTTKCPDCGEPQEIFEISKYNVD